MNTASLWRAGVASDPGLERENNEDRVLVDEAAGIFLVVDGIGGQAAGETAADVAVEVIAAHLANSTAEPERMVREAIAAANNEIFRLAEENPAWRGMACVLTLAVAREDRVTVGHVGDSRLYLAWDGKLRKLTSDHSPVGEREDQGELTELEAMRHPRRNQVFRDVGSKPREASDDDFIQVRSFPFHPDAALLLCSDGLSDTVPSSEIRAIVESYDGDPEEVSIRLVEAANRAGGKDNISVVFVAGPDFTTSRARHSTTRVRRHPRWRAIAGRLLWLLTGVALGIALWSAVPRLIPKYLPRYLPARPAMIPVNAGDPRGIVKAMNAARSGDTIEVPPGEFSGPVEFKNGVDLVASKPGAAVLQAGSGVAIDARHIDKGRISGLRIAGTGQTLVLLDHSAIEIDDTEISGAGGCAVRISGASPAVLRANFIHDNQGCGVWIGEASAPRLAGNRISANGGAAIEIHPPAGPSIENNILTGNGVAGFGPVPEAVAQQLRAKNVTE